MVTYPQDSAENVAACDTGPGTDASARVVGYRQAHRRVEAARGHASSYACEDCGRPAAEWSYSHGDPAELIALVNGKPRRYSAESDFYVARCIPCHRAFDRAHRVFRSW